MNSRNWFSALALSSYFLASWAQACGLRDNGPTLTDPVTGLEIRKCVVGLTWDGLCTGTPTGHTFDQAVARYGRSEWRLITKDEAATVIEKVKGCTFLSGGQRDTYALTTSPPGGNPFKFELWNFNVVGRIEGAPTDTYGVRLVRSRQ